MGIFEVFKTFIQRLETADGTDRIKVEDQMDSQGNLILPVRAGYLVDDEGGLHESANTSGNRVVKSWPDGSVVEIIGTFTKTGATAAGSIVIGPVAGDECIIMYGRIGAGPVVTGGGTTVTILDSTLSEMALLADLTMAANNVLNIPTAFADAAVAVGNVNGTPTIHQLMIEPNHALQVTIAGMAAGEVFSIVIVFRSLTGTAPGVVPVGGTFA